MKYLILCLAATGCCDFSIRYEPEPTLEDVRTCAAATYHSSCMKRLGYRAIEQCDK